MNAPAALGKVEQIRARDGDACWLCNRPLDFSAEPNSKNAPTIEHLVAKSLGGGGELTNLALCHPGCNGHLGDRPLAKKQELRAKWHANTAKLATAKASTSADAPARKLVARDAVSPPSSLANAPLPRPAEPWSSAEFGVEIAYWRRLALVGGGAGLVSVGFVAGLCIGLLAA